MTMDTAPPSGAAVLADWTSAPVADLLVTLVLAVYLLLLIQLGRTGRPWPVRRMVSAVAAAAILVLVVNSPLAIYSHHLFWVHMIVHLLLITVAPALIVWAQPIRLLHNAAGPTTRLRLDSFRGSRPFHWLMTPRFTVPLYAAVLVLTHLTGF